MKVLILVLASNQDPWKYIREEGQLKTWDSVEVDGVETVYYFPSTHFQTWRNGKDLLVQCPANFENMHWRLKLALDYALTLEWDYIFRTSASSYIHKKELIKKAETLPKEKCYCGIECCCGSVASGCGFFISRDVAKILANKIPFTLKDFHPDDVIVGKILEAEGIGVTSGAERYDFYHTDKDFYTTYHYRCKMDNHPNDGTKDVEAMRTIFNRLHNE